MKRLLCLILMSNLCAVAWAQRPSLDTSTFENWPSVTNPIISANGRYAAYTVEDFPQGSRTLIVRSVAPGWRKEFIGVDSYVFPATNTELIILKKDTLVRLGLGGDIKSLQSGITSYSCSNEWLAYQSDNVSKELTVLNLITNKAYSLSFITQYAFCKSGLSLIAKSDCGKGSYFLNLIERICVNDGKVDTLWTGRHDSADNAPIGAFTTDDQGRQIAFTLREGHREGSTVSIWYFTDSIGRAIKWAPEYTRIGSSGYNIMFLQYESAFRFDYTGNSLFFLLERLDTPISKKIQNGASVDIWSYKEEHIYSEQPFYGKKNTFYAVLHKGSHDIVRLETEVEMLLHNFYSSVPGEYLLSEESKFATDYWWNNEFSQSVYLKSTSDGSRALILKSKHFIQALALSPAEKFVTWYDWNDQSYYSYEIADKKISKISGSIGVPLFDDEKSAPDERTLFGEAGWMQNDERLLVYDRYDIWALDPKNKRPPQNITGRIGRKEHIVLGIASENINDVFRIGETIVVAGFSRLNKQNGLFKYTFGSKPSFPFEKLYSYSFCIPRTVPYTKGRGTAIEDISPGFPIKARDADVYLIMRMSAEESPNLFFTGDFSHFSPLSDVYPERKYNWMKNELLTWKGLDSATCNGILYKPQDFDPEKKYPVIFYYYEEKSDGLHMYIRPGPSAATINIPYYVSNGYLVFVPDIHFRTGEVGKGILNSVNSGVAYLSKFSWVNKEKLGLQGQSFGGFETNYIITHSNLFAAACEGSGTSDLVSSYGQLGGGLTGAGTGGTRQQLLEVGQSNLGTVPWEHPDIYIKNSAVFQINKVTTPLLIWHCKSDMAVPFEQAIEMFVDMRRANKKVWMLQYDGDGHMTTGNNALDLTIRMKQFFDYYLMDHRAPKWMTIGVPANLKGVETGYELDESGKTP